MAIVLAIDFGFTVKVKRDRPNQFELQTLARSLNLQCIELQLDLAANEEFLFCLSAQVHSKISH